MTAGSWRDLAIPGASGLSHLHELTGLERFSVDQISR
jgi:hypothetical protein